MNREDWYKFYRIVRTEWRKAREKIEEDIANKFIYWDNYGLEKTSLQTGYAKETARETEG